LETSLQIPLIRHNEAKHGASLEGGEITRFSYNGKLWHVTGNTNVSPRKFRPTPVAGVVFSGYERVYLVKSGDKEALAYVYFYTGHMENDLRAILDGFEDNPKSIGR